MLHAQVHSVHCTNSCLLTTSGASIRKLPARTHISLCERRGCRVDQSTCRASVRLGYWMTCCSKTVGSSESMFAFSYKGSQTAYMFYSNVEYATSVGWVAYACVLPIATANTLLHCLMQREFVQVPATVDLLLHAWLARCL